MVCFCSNRGYIGKKELETRVLNFVLFLPKILSFCIGMAFFWFKMLGSEKQIAENGGFWYFLCRKWLKNRGVPERKFYLKCCKTPANRVLFSFSNAHRDELCLKIHTFDMKLPFLGQKG